MHPILYSCLTPISRAWRDHYVQNVSIHCILAHKTPASTQRSIKRTVLTICEGIGLVGAVCLSSLFAESLQTPKVAMVIPTMQMAVLPFQLLGRLHQPPEGVQTSLG